MKIGFRLALLFLAALMVAMPRAVRAQTTTKQPVHVPPGQVLSPTLANSGQTPQRPLRVRVNLVRLPVTVRGPHGHLAINLGPENFLVYDNGNLQHIRHFDVGGSPMSVVLVVETSSRVSPLLPTIRKTGILFTDLVLGANGEGALIGFGDKTHLLVPFTASHDRLEKAIHDLKSGDSGVHLYDALYRAVQMLQDQPQNRRRVIIAISESKDTGSLNGIESVLRDAELANISIYTIGLSTASAKVRAKPTQASGPQFGPPGTFSNPGYPGVPQTPLSMRQQSGNVNPLPLIEMLVKMGVHLLSRKALKAAAAATGGDHVSALRDSSIQQAISRFGREMNAAYTIAYRAPTNGPWGYHTITVKVTEPGYSVRTRPGYFIAPPNGSTPSKP